MKLVNPIPQLVKRFRGRDSKLAEDNYTVIGLDSHEDIISDTHKILRAITPSTILSWPLLLFFAEMDPIGFRITYQTASNVIYNWFSIVDPVTGEKLDALDAQKEAFDRTVNLRAILIRWLYAERWGGWSIVVDWARFPMPSNTILKPSQSLEVFTRETATIIWDEETFLPRAYSVTKKGGNFSRKIEVPADIVYHLATRGDDPIEGMSALQPVGYDLTSLINITWGAGQTFFRSGTGFPVYTVPKGNLTPAAEAELKTQFKRIHTLMGLIIKGDHKLEFIGNKGTALNPNEYIDPVMKRISAGSGIPKMILEGAQAGALASGQTDQLNMNQFNKTIQSLITHSLEDLLIGSAGFPDDGWKIKFNDPQLSRLEQLAEEEKEIAVKSAKIDLDRKEKGPTTPAPPVTPDDPDDPEDPDDDPDDPESETEEEIESTITITE